MPGRASRHTRELPERPSHPWCRILTGPFFLTGRQEDMTSETGKTMTGIPSLSLGHWLWASVGLGALFWASGLLLWMQKASGPSIDQAVLFYCDPLRRADTWAVHTGRWLTSYGMAAITAIYVLLLPLGRRFKQFGLPAGLYLLVIFSFGLSGIGGDLLKELLARPRPMVAWLHR